MTETVAAVDREALIARAREIRPLLQTNAGQTDSLRRLPDEVVRALRDSGMCRLMVPKRFGGYQTSIRTYIEVMAELGQGCGSSAWVASLVNICEWLAALFPERAQHDVWGPDPDAWIAGSLAPNGLAVPVDGGWRVTGRWPWASGSLHAQWVACGIHMENERSEMTNLGLCLMPIADVTVEDTWFMVGMKGTGSNTIAAKDAFVPEHRFLPYPQAFQGQYRTEHVDEPVYRVPLVPVTVLILAGSQLGAARAGFDYVVSKSKTRGITHTTIPRQADSAGFQMLVADAAMKIDTAFLHALRAADDLDRAGNAGRHPDLTERARVRMDTSLVAKYAREAVELLEEDRQDEQHERGAAADDEHQVAAGQLDLEVGLVDPHRRPPARPPCWTWTCRRTGT